MNIAIKQMVEIALRSRKKNVYKGNKVKNNLSDQKRQKIWGQKKGHKEIEYTISPYIK